MIIDGIVVVSRITRLVYHPCHSVVTAVAMLDHGGSLCQEEHSKSKLVYTASTINQIKTLLAILFCILKNNASGYPATVTAVDIIDTMYVFIDLFISVRCF